MPFILLSRHERLEFEYEGATLYYHRLGHDARSRVAHESTERGMQNLQDYWLLTCQEAIDAWENIYDADMQAVPVPPSGEDQRSRIADLVQHFPLEALQRLAEQALADAPEAIKKRWNARYPDVSALPISGPGESLPVAIADARGQTIGSVSPATEGG
jgi:hypothetical protein